MRHDHLKKIIDKQFKIAGLDLKFEDVMENKIPNWFKKYTCTSEQNSKWKNWTKKYIKEKLKMTSDRAFIQTAWLEMNYGLKIKDEKKKKTK